jgi:hypothetical protein
VALHAVLENSEAKSSVIAQIIVAVVLWGVAEVFWLKASYGLEVEGKHNFRTLLAASASLLIAHIVMLVVFIRAFVNSRKEKKESETIVTRSPRAVKREPSAARARKATESSDEPFRRSSRLRELSQKL